MEEPIDRIIAGLAPDRKVSKAKKGAGPRDQVRMGWVNTRDERRLIAQAAALRGISIAGFCRRAVLAFAYHTLGLDYYEEMKGDREVQTPFGPVERYGRTDYGRTWVEGSADGRGCGTWRITGLEGPDDEPPGN